MEDYDYSIQPLMIAVASTFGNGDSPENGQSFMKRMSAARDLLARDKLRKTGSVTYHRAAEHSCLSHREPHFYSSFVFHYEQVCRVRPGIKRLCYLLCLRQGYRPADE